MLSVLRRSLRTRRATTRYPDAPDPTPAAFRGQVTLRVDRCRGEAACAADCPSQAITVERLAAGGWVWELDDARCVFCGLCVEACPHDALAHSTEFELAVRDAADLVTRVHFNAAASSTSNEEGATTE